MSFPPTLTTRTLKGRFVSDPDGEPAEGSVRIILSDFMLGPTDDAIVAPFDKTIPFDSNGEISIRLPSNNDPQWTPAVYKIVVTSGKSVHRQTFDVPYNSTADIDLAHILNVPVGTPGESYILLASKGVAGGVASLGNDGKIPSSQLPAGTGDGSGPVEWDDIQNKPTTFPPTAIQFSDIQNKPTSYPSSWTDVSGKPAAFTPATHSHTTSDVTGLDSALASKATTAALTSGLATKADASAVTTALGSKADLVGGVLPTSQLPTIAVIEFLGSTANEAAMLALTGQKGDWTIRTDLGQHWVITGSNPTQLSSWTSIPLPTIPVQTVNGQTGAVVLAPGDIGLGNVNNTSDANKPVSTAQQDALDLKAPLNSPSFTGTVSGVTAAMVGLGNVNNTSDAAKPVSTATQEALDDKADLNHTHTMSEITDIGAKVIVLSAAASVPGGTPAGTVIVRTAT